MTSSGELRRSSDDAVDDQMRVEPPLLRRDAGLVAVGGLRAEPTDLLQGPIDRRNPRGVEFGEHLVVFAEQVVVVEHPLLEPLAKRVGELIVDECFGRAGSPIAVHDGEQPDDEAGHREVRFGCHIALFVPTRHAINIREEAGDLFEAIDLAEKRLVNDLTNFRERKLTEARQPKSSLR